MAKLIKFKSYQVGWFAHPIFSKEGDYPNAMKERIKKRSEEQGYTKSRLPEFTADEIEYIKGTYDFLGLNHYTTYSVKANAETNFVEPSFEHDRGVEVFQEASWPSSASSWLKVNYGIILTFTLIDHLDFKKLICHR